MHTDYSFYEIERLLSRYIDNSIDYLSGVKHSKDFSDTMETELYTNRDREGRCIEIECMRCKGIHKWSDLQLLGDGYDDGAYRHYYCPVDRSHPCLDHYSAGGKVPKEVADKLWDLADTIKGVKAKLKGSVSPSNSAKTGVET